jgi:hypothetical protein
LVLLINKGGFRNLATAEFKNGSIADHDVPIGIKRE